MEHQAIIPMSEYKEFMKWKEEKYKKQSSVVYEDDRILFQMLTIKIMKMITAPRCVQCNSEMPN